MKSLRSTPPKLGAVRVAPDGKQVRVVGLDRPIRLRERPEARRLTLRLTVGGDLVLTCPERVPAWEIERFVAQNRIWLESRIDHRPPPTAFADGEEIPLRGRSIRLRHDPSTRSTGRLLGGELIIGGDPEHFARRCLDFLKMEARRDLVEESRRLAGEIGRRVARVSVKDTVSRWGSCSSTGNLNFSWRLILAPSDVLTYVVAHEVAHLVHMNHGPEFWRVCAGLTPGGRVEMERHRLWLKRNGASLHRYGA